MPVAHGASGPVAQGAPEPTGTTGPTADDAGAERRARFWSRNVRLVRALLLVWLVVSFGAAILLAPWLDRVRVPGTGFRLGFWTAQQGSILVFVVLIFVYARRMARIERECGVDEDAGPEGDAERRP